jgi:hypothetical protein
MYCFEVCVESLFWIEQFVVFLVYKAHFESPLCKFLQKIAYGCPFNNTKSRK